MKNYLLKSLFVFFFTACGTNSIPNSTEVNAKTVEGISASIACFYDPLALSGPIKYVLNCYVHTVDSDSNPVNNLNYKLSVITNIKLTNSIGRIATTNPISFSDREQSFLNSDIKATDTLIILPTPATSDVSYLGSWQIASIDSNSTLTLKESAFNLETTENLTYVIGNETRYDLGGTASAHIEYSDSTDKNSTILTSISDKGLFYFRLVFDYKLEGKTVVVGAYAGNNRIGVSTSFSLVIEKPKE
jgi:hypothetical protein